MIIAQSPSGFQDSAFQTHMDHSYMIRRVQGEQQDGPMQDACLRLGSTPEGLHNTLGARADQEVLPNARAVDVRASARARGIQRKAQTPCASGKLCRLCVCCDGAGTKSRVYLCVQPLVACRT